ncbi:copper amine oxidase N-terminal domain-containing protein [Paenibacillus sp. UMB7766-LJ446]|uniref:copper amine oxidase N-terminal domain-containing protein n=1 Tax=Paenibacillus sp. UMB7766-LJ446 TaxID=3046313 RepID=UPI00254FFD61|nr:copper amine oxidase N-terminal domain-containing protein [Paenibacillus sp. UMB7766-LJ446]MDK8193712.1 copper amine oxidase N-terminal domain-containing protein [Paenibacillus sp. UMB7766-LJ446]
MKKAGGRQVKKVMSALAVSAMLMSALPTSVMDAAARISIYINDAELSSAQAPVMKGGRVLVPLRSIFEGLDATVKYTNKTKTITAVREDQEVILKLGSKTAYINGEAISLDVPANTIKGNTMVPIRFVSEAFGEKVFWNSRNQRVDIKTTSTPPVDETKYAAWNIYGSVSGSNGDGRDLTVSFTRPTSEKAVSSYRIMLVKTRDVNSFNESAASVVPSGNYTSVSPNGTDPRLTLNAQTRDVNGDLLNTSETYRLYVLTMGNSNNNYKNLLAWSSQSLKLNNVKTTVQPVTGLRIADISDYGDGRDMEINFTQPSTTSNITYYRAFVVKAKDASSFNLTTANNVTSSNSTIIYKGNSTAVKSLLSSSTRDTSGELIKNGTSYVVYIMSVSSNAATADNKLSSVSSSLTLGVNTATAPVITSVRDNSDYGDGRDIQVSFNRSSDESKVANYRIFVVRNSVSSSFNLTTASNLSSSLYYNVNKTGNNITTTLPSSMKDTSGYNVTNLQDYRIYVMAVGNQQNGYTNALSSSSTQLRLTTNSNAGVASNIGVADVSDYGDGRDLRVSFNRASDESNVSVYRVYVVRSGNAGSFTLSAANASNNYYQVNKTGGNQSFTLPNYMVDTNGYTLSNNVSYRVFVLSVSTSGNSSQNALSSYSSQITLTANAAVTAPSNVAATDIGDNLDGRDLRVTFTKSADETNVNHYRVFVVKSGTSFNLASANAVGSANYTYVSKNGNNQTVNLSSGAKTADGSNIVNGVAYQVYVMAVNNNGSLANALSSGSGVITLASNTAVAAVSNVNATVKNQGQAGDASDVSISFSKASSENGISGYKAFIVPANQVSGFSISSALGISYNIDINKNDASSPVFLNNGHRDINNKPLVVGQKYRVFVLSVSDSSSRASNLSAASNEFNIFAQATEVKASTINELRNTSSATEASYKIFFSKPSIETGISEYRLIVVKGSDSLNPASAATAVYKAITPGELASGEINLTQGTKDSTGADISVGGEYKVYILSVAGNTTTYSNALSAASSAVKLELAKPDASVQVTNPTADPAQSSGNKQ